MLGPLAFAFADRFTVGFFTTTFSLYLKRIHDLPPARIGMLIAAFMLPFALLSAPSGWLSQRMSRAVLLCGGSLLYGIGTASLTSWSPEALPFFMASLGAIAALMFVPSMLMTTELTPEEVRTTSMGAFNAAGSLGFIAGPLTGGLVSQLVAASAGWEAGYRAAFGVAGMGPWGANPYILSATRIRSAGVSCGCLPAAASASAVSQTLLITRGMPAV